MKTYTIAITMRSFWMMIVFILQAKLFEYELNILTIITRTGNTTYNKKINFTKKYILKIYFQIIEN
jgi:hypothetical protein